MINAQTVTTPNGSEMTQTDLDLLSGPELVSLYNLSAGNMEEERVRKFKDLATGRKRTWAMLERYTVWVNEDEEAEVGMEDEDDFDFDPDFDEPKQEVFIKKGSTEEFGDTKVFEKPKKLRQHGVGAFIKEQLEKGETPKDIIEQVQGAFPGSKATTRDVAWYKSQMKKEQE